MNIHEIDSLKNIYQFLNDETLLVLDLDNTLIESVSHYGSYQWGSFLTQRAAKEGLSLDKALEKVMPIWDEAQYEIEMRSIEDNLHIRMNEMMAMGVKCFALTGRSPQLAEVTLKQLEKNLIEFSSWNFDHLSFDLPSAFAFQKGVFFAGTKNKKGSVLLQIMNQLDHSFKRVVFVDDQMYLVEQVREALKGLPLEYFGIRYSGADKRVLEFDYSTAESEKENILTN